MRYFVFLVIVTFIILGSVVCVSLSPAPLAQEPGFIGSAACASCHRAIFDSSHHTAHYFTSRPASDTFIKGSFDEGKNVFVYNPWMSVLMEQREDGYWQTSFVNGVPMEERKFGIVIGSGRKGQTYLYWEENKLFQLPVSYYTPDNNWCNSPGYPTNYVKFNRPIVGACIECHGTYADTKVKDGTTYFNKIIYGVDCERCHGPGAEHVSFHTAYPQEKTAKSIIGIKRLSRQQRLDACAMCHSGFRKEIQPAFSYMVGQRLDDYSVPNPVTDSMDVHGNQYGLLTSSKCFRKSELDCSSCHNVHANEVNSPVTFSQRCLNCHNSPGVTCTVKPAKGLVLESNCIDCHMPLLESKKITLKLAVQTAPDLVRTHKVGIYKKQTAAFIRALRR
jgi:hypothetical protein